ncbi:MAG: nucleotide sugar dehydrogenase [Magnetococcales bacterium]|nr:nucleotide sugar dehydrogenase [Magnetococcales bacterium]
MKQTLIDKIECSDAVIGVIGLGYVGLPLVNRFLEEGFRVIGFDIDVTKIDKLDRNQGYIEHIDFKPIFEAIPEGRFEGTIDLGRSGEADALILCVPTPLSRNREPDLSYVVGSVEAVVPHLRKGQVVSLESTTYPGTTEEEMRPRVEADGLKVGEDIFLVYSPEREDPGNPDFSTRSIPKVCGGSTPACAEVGVALYQRVVDKVVPVSSTGAAEMVKILENTYRAVNIALVNELKVVADQMSLDIFEVINAAATKPFGFTPFYPGPGLGGHCIPIDPFYLTWKAREFGVNTRFIELAGEVNTAMPDYVISKISEALNDHCKPIRGSRILVLGFAYKKNVDDVRESPSVVLMERLLARGAEVGYADPHVPEIPPMRAHDLKQKALVVTPEMLTGFDCVLVATQHDAFDWEMIKTHAPVIVDARGVFSVEKGRIYRA